MKTSTQLKALIRNLSSQINIPAEILLRNFIMERFLERIAVSKYKNNFILKGGMLISALVGIETRTTMDMDVTVKGKILNASEITDIVKDIIRIPLEDYVEFSFKRIEEIREELDYPCFRVSIDAIFDKTRQTIKIDITTGDFVTPREIEYNYKIMFENRKINIMTYNLETVLSEKIETIITRSVTNTRMRDFYDIYILTTTQTFDVDIFKEALYKTIKKRGSDIQMSGITETIMIIENSQIMIDLWHRYQKIYIYANNISWKMVMETIKNLAHLLK